MSSSARSRNTFSRREFLGTAALAAGALACPASLLAQNAATNTPAASAANQRYRIAVCDWMILKRQKLGAFQLTKEIGADGVEVDMGSLGDRDTFDNKLAD